VLVVLLGLLLFLLPEHQVQTLSLTALLQQSAVVAAVVQKLGLKLMVCQAVQVAVVGVLPAFQQRVALVHQDKVLLAEQI
jgi:D-alanine-D-alanine ligase-like ATP-grasp enzyme